MEEKKDKELTEEELEQAVGGKLTRLIDGDRGPHAGGGGAGGVEPHPLPDNIRL